MVCGDRDGINLAVLDLLESGQLQKLHSRWWYDKGQCAVDDAKVNSSPASTTTTTTAAAALAYYIFSHRHVSLLSVHQRSSLCLSIISLSSHAARSRRSLTVIERQRCCKSTMKHVLHVVYHDIISCRTSGL